MIVLDILHNIFEILPELILGAGPFCVFKGMGDGKDSGKLLFKKIYTGSGITITEDSTSLDIKSTGGGGGTIPIVNEEIAFGNSTNNGLTSSTFRFCENPTINLVTEHSLLGLSILGGYNHCNKSGVFGNGCSLIVGGSGSYIITNVKESVIVGGQKNCIIGITRNCRSAIIGGTDNYVTSSNFSTILGSVESTIECGWASSILSTTTGTNYKTFNSSLMLSDQGIIKSSTQSSNFGSNNYISQSRSSFVNGLANSLTSSCFSSILNGTENTLTRSETSTIANGCKNFLNLQINSSIINGYKNYIDSLLTLTLPTPVRGIGNTIVNGKYNYICNRVSLSAAIFAKYNTVLNGTFNKIYTPSSNSTIINGNKNTICLGNSTIISGDFNSIESLGVAPFDLGRRINSTIIQGRYSEVCTALSTIFSRNGDSQNHSIIKSTEASISGDKPGYGNTIIEVGYGYASLLGQFYNSCIDGSPSRHNSIISSVGRGQKISYGLQESLNQNCNNSIINVMSSQMLEDLYGKPPLNAQRNFIGSFTMSKNYSPVNAHKNFNNTILAWGSSMSSLRGSTNIRPGRGLTTSYSSIIGGVLHNIYATCDSLILGGCKNLIIEGRSSAIIGGYNNYIGGFRNDTENQAPKGVINSVIVGGQNNCFRSPKPVCNSVIIGGSNLTETESRVVRVQNMALYSRLAYYNFATQTKYTGVDGSKTTIASLTVCNGIIVSWT